jgi:hypothetical protein
MKVFFKNLYEKFNLSNMQLIIILVVFVLLAVIIYYLFSFEGETSVLYGVINAKHGKVIEQDPNHHNAIPIYRSNNALKGLEFTWSVWVNVEDLDYGAGKEKLIFNKGNQSANCPGLYIDKNTNNFIVKVDNFNSDLEEIVIKDFTLNKWINIIIRCENLYIDVYINGNIVRRHKCSSLPKQNYGNVHVAIDGGFSGLISDLYYWNYSLGTSKINSLVNLGPSLHDYNPFSMHNTGGELGHKIYNALIPHKTSSDAKNVKSDPNNSYSNYYSLRWFLGNDNKNANSIGYGGL